MRPRFFFACGYNRRKSCESFLAEAVASPPCRLAFGAPFYFDCNVSPVPDEVTSTAATGTIGQHGGVAVSARFEL